MNYVFSFILVGLLGETQSRDIPIRYVGCRRRLPDFPKCISKAVADGIVSFAEGASDFEIAPLDPLEIFLLSVDKNNPESSMKLNYTNIKVLGLSKLLVKIRFKSIYNDLSQLRFDAYHARIDISSDYFMDSNTSHVHMGGSGRAHITLLNVTTENAIYCEKYEKNGQQFLNVTKYEIKLHSSRVSLRLNNLFRQVGADRTKFDHEFNENSLVYHNTKEQLEENFGSNFQQMTNKIFSRIPLNYLFPD